MKRISCLALCLALLFLTACQASSSIQTSQQPKDLLLTSMYSLLTTSTEPFHVATKETLAGSQYVKVDKALLQNIADILTENDNTVADIDYLENCTQDFTIQGGTPYCAIQLYAFSQSHEVYSGKSILWLQIGEESASYLYTASIFDEIYALLAANLTEEIIHLQGEHTSIQSAYDSKELRQSDFYLVDALEFENRLLLVYHSPPATSYVEIIDLKSGKSIHQMELSSTVLRANKIEYTAYDYRLLCAGFCTVPQRIMQMFTPIISLNTYRKIFWIIFYLTIFIMTATLKPGALYIWMKRASK